MGLLNPLGKLFYEDSVCSKNKPVYEKEKYQIGFCYGGVAAIGMSSLCWVGLAENKKNIAFIEIIR